VIDFGEELRRLAAERGISLRELARRVGCSAGYLSNVTSGRKPLTPSLATRLDQVLGTGDQLIAYALGPGREYRSELNLDLVRRELDSALGKGMMAGGGLDDWEQTVIRYGCATRDRPADDLLNDISADLAELRLVLERHRSASALRQLTRVAAQMSGLIGLILVKLDERTMFRGWARTARIAANEAGDPVTFSWVLAQESYGHYYNADYREAVEVACCAQDIVHGDPCVGAALAAALEGRAHAAMGHQQAAREALGHAESILSHLCGDELASSAFGYNEGQLRFHESSAYTSLHDIRSALKAQDRALELCRPNDYTDWSMTRLDRAACLAQDGDTVGALAYAVETLGSLAESQRQGIITLRGYELLNSLPERQHALPAARDFQRLLTPTNGSRRVTDS
jgi:transcriptional regulator with XRE-family HTH domain